jgi:pyrroline-5-carboxylate reductase
MSGGQRVGIVGAGSMATALARGWAMPIVCSDAGSGRAKRLAAEIGGRAVAGNAVLAQESDIVVLCHKPHQLEVVARQLGTAATSIVSVLSGVSLARLRAAFPNAHVRRFAVNLPVEVRRGVVLSVVPHDVPEEIGARVDELFARLGVLIQIDERALPAAIAISGVGPAYLAMIIESQVDAAIRHGLQAELACELAVEAMAGTSALVQARGGDTLGVRRCVTSPGGVTARGLAALEAGGLRAAFVAAADETARHVPRAERNEPTSQEMS